MTEANGRARRVPEMQADDLKEITSRASSLLHKVTVVISGILLASIAVIVNVGVFYRYILFDPIPWSEQIPKYAMIWMGFLGASSALYADRHMGFDFLITRLPSRAKEIITLAGMLLILLFLVFLTIYGVVFAFAVGFSSTAPMLGFPMFYLFLTVPIGGVFMILQAVAKIVLRVSSR